MPKSTLDLSTQLLSHRKLSLRLKSLISKGMDQSSEIDLKDLLCYGLFVQAHQSYISVRVLIKSGLFDDAFSVVRSMVEKIINGAYIRQLDEDSAFDFVEFTAFKSWRDYQALRESSPDFASVLPKSYISKLETGFDRLGTEMKLGRFGRGHDWTKVGLRNRAEIVDQTNAFLGIGKILSARVLYDFCYRESAPFVHGLFPSIKALYKVERGKLPQADGYVRAKVYVALRNPDPQVAKDALSCSNFAAIYLLFLADGIFNQSKNFKSVAALMTKHIASKNRESIIHHSQV